MTQRWAIAGTVAIAAFVMSACGGASATAEPTDAPWSKSMGVTTCAEWRDNDVMSDRQRDVAATAVVGADAALRFVFAINDACDTLGELATDESDPANIEDVMEFVLSAEDFTRVDD